MRPAKAPWWRLPFQPPARLLAARNLRSDRFGTLASLHPASRAARASAGESVHHE